MVDRVATLQSSDGHPISIFPVVFKADLGSLSLRLIFNITAYFVCFVFFLNQLIYLTTVMFFSFNKESQVYQVMECMN